MTGPSDRIADHLAVVRWRDLPPVAVAAAKRSLLDALGVSLAATRLGDGCAAFLDLVVADGGAERSVVLGRGVRVPPQHAAFANGALAHALDFEDTHDAAVVHPNAATVPAALAIAEAGNHSGRDLLLAIAVGSDLTCRLGLGLKSDPGKRGWYTPAILSAFGAAAAAGVLLRLDRRGMLDTLSLTLCQATCSAEITSSPDALIRGVREAFSARAGVQAALLAEKRVTGFDQPLEGKAGFYALYGGGGFDESKLCGDLGRRFEGADVSFKPWPTCRGTHVYIDMLLRLLGDHDIAPASIDSIEIDVNSLNVMLCEPVAQKQAPRVNIDAKFSLPFTLALSALRGAPELSHFTPTTLVDVDILRLAARVRHTLEPSWPYHEPTRGRLQLRLRDGRQFSANESVAPGHPDRPMSDAALQAKFRSCAKLTETPLADSAIDRIIDIVMALEQSTARDLANALH